MADDNTIIEGPVKFRDGKKWKSRWCVMRKLSPVADCVHMQLYRDWRARGGGAGCKASLSLADFLGAESAFTLDKHSNTLALVCRDLVVVLAFETRERLIQWQVKVARHVGESRVHEVVVAPGAGGGGRRGRAGGPAPGPARLHVAARRAALTAGAPPRLLGVWEMQHLRRFGVVEGRFCFEGGAACGRGAGAVLLAAPRAHELARDFALAARGRLPPRPGAAAAAAAHDYGAESPTSPEAYRPDTRLSELHTIDRAPPTELRLAAAPAGAALGGAAPGGGSPYWRCEGDDLGPGDTESLRGLRTAGREPPWGADATLQRCTSCMSKLGALSRSSTAALTPGAKHFSPAWTMEALGESAARGPPAEAPDPAEPCRCDAPPDRPPRPTGLDLDRARKPPMPLPPLTCSCAADDRPRIGPYENYDVPKVPSTEVEGEYYDTPRRLKECLSDELFKITRSSTADALILQKPCGCLLKFGRRRREPIVVDAEESLQPAGSCPCRRVTAWANDWIKLPYCRRTEPASAAPAEERATPEDDRSALYATVDVARKTRRKTPKGEAPETDEGPLAHYENLNFALSLEHYENAKDLLRRAGVTQRELDAIGANLRPPGGPAPCGRCGRPARAPPARDEYLVMRPPGRGGPPPPPAGYAPMSPIGGFPFHTMRHPRGAAERPLEAKSASNPALAPRDPPPAPGPDPAAAPARGARVARRERSSSADSARFLEDVEEFEGGRESTSSIETLRNLAPAAGAGAGGAAGAARGAAAGEGGEGGAGGAGGNRSSSSSNDSGVSVRRPRAARRRARSAGALCARGAAGSAGSAGGGGGAKSSSAEAEVPVLAVKPLRGVADAHSTSSGTSDMSDYIETLSICSSHSSTDAPVTLRVARQTSTLRPRSGKEYHSLDPRLTSGLRLPPHAPQPPLPGRPHLYTNLP